MSDNSRRLKYVEIDRRLLANLLRLDGTKRIKIEGLPADAELVGMSLHVAFDRDLVALKFQSAEFPEVASGCCMERLDLTVTEIVELERTGMSIEDAVALGSKAAAQQNEPKTVAFKEFL